MRTNPKTASAYHAATVIVLALYLVMLTALPDTAPGPTVLDPPWEQAAIVVTEAELQAAQELARYLRTLPGEGHQGGIRELEWTRGWLNRPIGNLDRVALRKLLVGNRFVYRNAVLDPESRLRDDQTHLQHFGEDGILRTCEGGHWQRHRYHIVDDLAGAATYVTEFIGTGREASRLGHDRDDTGWWKPLLNSRHAWFGRPITFDPLTVTLAIHSENTNGTWSHYIGHVQAGPSDRPESACSEGQGTAGGRPITRGHDPAIRRGIVPLFRQDPARPLRMGTYFSLFPPPEEITR